MNEAHETVKTFSNELEATLARSKLAEGGIEATVHRYSRYRAMAGGGYVLKVPVARLDEARRLLGALDTGIDMDEYVDADEPSYRRCPVCGSVNVDTRPLDGRQVLWVLVSVGFYLLAAKRDRRCRKCGAHWRD